MARKTLRRLLAASLLAAFTSIGIPFDDRASATTFSITEDSPEAAPGGDFDGADVIPAFGNPPPQIEAAALGLGPNDELDAHSFGRDFIFPVGPFNVSFLTYSVSRATQGAGGPVTNQVGGNGAAGDKFRVIVLPAGLTLGPGLISDAPNHNLTPRDAGFESELDALSDPPSARETVFFSIDPATAAGQPFGASDIMYVGQPGVDSPVLYLSAQDMGLQAGDNIDAIAIRDTGQRGVADANDVVHISLDAQSPTRAIFFPAGGDGVIQVRPGPTTVAIAPARLDIGSGPLEELDAMTASDPGPEFGLPEYQLLLNGGDGIGGIRADDIQTLGIGSTSALLSATEYGASFVSALVNVPLAGGEPQTFVDGDSIAGESYFLRPGAIEAVLNEDEEIAFVASRQIDGATRPGVLVGPDLENLWPAIPPGDASLVDPSLSLIDIPMYEGSPAYTNRSLASAVAFDGYRRGMRFVSPDGQVSEILDGVDTPPGLGVARAVAYSWPAILKNGSETRTYFKVEGDDQNGSYVQSIIRRVGGQNSRLFGTGSQVEGETLGGIDTFRPWSRGVVAIASANGVPRVVRYDRETGVLRRITGIPYESYYLLCSRLSRRGNLWLKAHGFESNSVYYKDLTKSVATRRILAAGETVPGHPGWTIDYIDNVNSQGERAVITVIASNPSVGAEGPYALSCSGTGGCRTLIRSGSEIVHDGRTLPVYGLYAYNGATGGIAQGRNAAFNELGDFWSTVFTSEGPAAVRTRWNAFADRDGDGSPDPIDVEPDDARIVSLVNPMTGSAVELRLEDPAEARFARARIRRPVSSNGESSFENGVLDFEIRGVSEGAAATITAKFSGESLVGTIWKKILAGSSGGAPVTMPGASRIADDTYRVTLTDGGEFDADGVANGVIVDPSGPSGDAASPDRDGDGVSDDLDNCQAEPNVDQRDTDADGYGNVCDFDYDGDEFVDLPDFNILVSAFNGVSTDPGFDPDVDANGDGAVDLDDFNGFVAYFVGPPGPSGLACAGSIPCAAP